MRSSSCGPGHPLLCPCVKQCSDGLVALWMKNTVSSSAKVALQALMSRSKL